MMVRLHIAESTKKKVRIIAAKGGHFLNNADDFRLVL